jgi:tRNA G18 (ribose-2'-O)-methylase SpoU
MRVEPIEDPADPRVADYGDLRGAAARRRGLFVAEGRIVVERLLRAGRFRPRSLLLTPACLEALGPALTGAGPGLAVYVAPHALIRRIAGFPFHRGCLALAERGPELEIGSVLEGAEPRLLLGLEDLADPDNLGALFRSAAAFGVQALVLSPGAADPLSRKAIRVSMGATLCLPWVRARDWDQALTLVEDAGYRLAALTPRAEALDIAALTGGPVPPRLALLVGAEGRGLAPATLGRAYLRLRIPMAPGADSLNAATAAAIALYRLRTSACGGERLPGRR